MNQVNSRLGFWHGDVVIVNQGRGLANIPEINWYRMDKCAGNLMTSNDQNSLCLFATFTKPHQKVIATV